MSILSGNISIKIKEVSKMSWDISTVSVAARPYHALVFRIRGNASFLCGDFSATTNAGDVFYMPSGCSYDAIYGEKNEVLVIHFESDLISKMKNYRLNDSHLISLLFYKLYDIWSEKAEGYYYMALSTLCEILESISVQQASGLYAETRTAFEAAVAYMENNYMASNFSIRKMIATAYMSNTYFRKLFYSKFGVTPAKYLTSKRLVYAEKLLSTGKYSIKEVAEMSGFGDAKYFSRVVKSNYGVPPSKLYRHIDAPQ